MSDKGKTWRDPKDEFGVGMLANGTLDVVTPEEHRRRAIERNAEEAVDDDQPEAEEDFADLETENADG